MTKPHLSIERRQFGRKPSHIHGTIRLTNGSTLACLVENYSASGAFLRVETSKRLPRMFRLTISRTGLQTDCSVVRREGQTYGVAFVTSEFDRPTGIPGDRRVITYDQLLALASADRLQEEFHDRFGLAILKAERFDSRLTPSTVR